MKRIATVMALVLIGAASLTGLWRMSHSPAPSKPSGERRRSVEAPVTVATVVRKSLPVERKAFGVVEPVATVSVRSQITGVLSNACFEEGQDVREGDLLFVIDPAGPEADRKQAAAALSRSLAQLKQAEKEALRQEDLLKKGIATEDSRDQARTAVDVLKAQIQAEQAALDRATLQAGYCFIRAPMDGRTGALLMHRGNLVRANDTALVTLNRIRPIMVKCAFPQQDLGFIREHMAADAFQVLAGLPGTGARTVTGAVTFVANAVDSETGTIQIKARFENRNSELWPGQLVAVTLRAASGKEELVIPARAVLPGQKGAYVYVVSGDRTVSNRLVQIERTMGEEAVVSAGVAAGDCVVTDGQLRLAPGTRVSIPAEKASAPAGRP